jgi:hypothetical protein
LNTIVKRFGFSLVAVALFCALSWAATSAHAASQTSQPKQGAPSSCSSTQVTVTQQNGATVCVNMDQIQGFPKENKVVSIHNGTGVLAVFNDTDGENIVVINPGETNNNLPMPDKGTEVKVLSSSCSPTQVAVIQRNDDTPVCLDKGNMAMNLTDVLVVRNGTNACAIFSSTRVNPTEVGPGQTQTFPVHGFTDGGGMVMVLTTPCQ